MDLSNYKPETFLHPVRQLFRVNAPEEKIYDALKKTYIARVRQREIPFQDDLDTNNKIKIASKWLTGSYKAGLILYGTFGNGKTTLAKSICDIINHVDSTSPVLYISARDLSRKAKDNPEDFNLIIKHSKLYVDDFGWEPQIVKNWGNQINPVVEVIEERFKKMDLTILTSNKSDEEIKNIYGEYIYERITEQYEKIYFEHKSYRI
jgi:DNA replication protein DnaC